MYDIKQMYSFMKMKGYSHSKDVLGTYFDNHKRKLTINKQANWYTCFHNEKQGNGWVLMNKSGVFDSFQAALNWVVMEVQKTKE